MDDTTVYLFTYEKCLPCPHWFVYIWVMTQQNAPFWGLETWGAAYDP